MAEEFLDTNILQQAVEELIPNNWSFGFIDADEERKFNAPFEQAALENALKRIESHKETLTGSLVNRRQQIYRTLLTKPFAQPKYVSKISDDALEYCELLRCNENGISIDVDRFDELSERQEPLMEELVRESALRNAAVLEEKLFRFYFYCYYERIDDFDFCYANLEFIKGGICVASAKRPGLRPEFPLQGIFKKKVGRPRGRKEIETSLTNFANAARSLKPSITAAKIAEKYIYEHKPKKSDYTGKDGQELSFSTVSNIISQLQRSGKIIHRK